MAKRRNRGDGSLHLRKDGRWEGRYVVGYDDKGLPITKNVLAKTKLECTAKLAQLRDTLKEPAPDQPKPGILLVDWLDLWYQGYKKPNLRPNTQMSYERRIYQHITPTLGQIQLDKLTTADIQEFYVSLKKSGRLIRADLYGEGLSDQTVRGIHTTLHAALDKAVEENLIFRNPSDGCKLPSAKPREMKVLMPEEIQRLLIQAREDGCYELLLLELSTGLRRGEICGLRWEDFDEAEGTLKVNRSVSTRKAGSLEVGETKTNKGRRTISLPDSTAQRLRERKKTAISDWIFPNPLHPEEPVNPGYAYNRMKTVLKNTGLPSIRFHDLRHTFATHALAGGVDAKTLSGILGHTNASFTLDTYTHVTGDMQKQAANTVCDFMTDLLGEEWKPWQENERTAKEL